jgi:hypothetical protein
MKRKLDFLRLIDLIYEAATDARNWANAVIAIAAALGAPAISLSIADAEAKESPFLVAPRDDSERIRRIFNGCAVSDIMREWGIGSSGGLPHRLSDFSARQDFVLFARLGDERGAVAGIGFHRSLRDAPFATEDKRLLTALTPHLQRAVALNRRLRDLETERDGVTALLDRFDYGALLVDAEAHILFANAAAQSLLRERAGLCAREGRPAACRPAKTAGAAPADCRRRPGPGQPAGGALPRRLEPPGAGAAVAGRDDLGVEAPRGDHPHQEPESERPPIARRVARAVWSHAGAGRAGARDAGRRRRAGGRRASRHLAIDRAHTPPRNLPEDWNQSPSRAGAGHFRPQPDRADRVWVIRRLEPAAPTDAHSHNAKK